ncbi:hypothetical protein N9L19_00800 [bacterium]|nr:hypothetical protein [bacterium]
MTLLLISLLLLLIYEDLDATDNGDAKGNQNGRKLGGRVFLVEEINPEIRAQGPIATAKFLCDAASLNEDQMHPVALIAKPMDKPWRDRGEELAGAGTEHTPLIPLGKKIIRILIVGGGGCGKTRIINQVLTPLFRAFFGTRGCMGTAPSNKAARLLGGKTMHTWVKMRGGKLSLQALRVGQASSKALSCAFVPVGA